MLLKIKEQKKGASGTGLWKEREEGWGENLWFLLVSQRPVGEGRMVSDLSEGAAGLSGGKGGCVLSVPQQRRMSG